MPERHAQTCRVLGCGHVEPCPLHTTLRPVASASAKGYDRRWRAFTVVFFGELWDLRVPRAGLCGCRHPSAPATNDSKCAALGRAQLATLVDHIAPIQGKQDPRFFDRSNLQGLCDRCHNKKRQRESQMAKRGA